MVGLKFTDKLKDNKGLKLAYFMQVIIPVLKWAPNCKYLTKEEGVLLSDLVVGAPLFKLTQDQALSYC
jgi:hypothetical protein